MSAGLRGHVLALLIALLMLVFVTHVRAKPSKEVAAYCKMACIAPVTPACRLCAPPVPRRQRRLE